MVCCSHTSMYAAAVLENQRLLVQPSELMTGPVFKNSFIFRLRHSRTSGDDGFKSFGPHPQGARTNLSIILQTNINRQRTDFFY
ncbi:hypothetical protein COXBURSA331_A0327 [Coxiella burnetii RSA 331]|nr:hypothetical protein COXBURSA331_A0327 [Coxiella burnetii RSA 331]